MTDQTLKLASEFPAVDYAAWRELAEAALKGAPFDKKLVTRSPDGFDFQPIYTAHDSSFATDGIHDALIAATRQDTPRNGWDIRQLHSHPDPKSVNEAILEDLENGTTSIILRLDAAARTGRDAHSDDAGLGGVMIYSLADLEIALADFYSELAPVSLDAGTATIAASAILAARLDQDEGEKAPAFNFDPLGTLVRDGYWPADLSSAMKQAAGFARDIAEKYPAATAINVNTTAWHHAGATDSMELAIAMATGVAYLRALTDGGMTVDKAASTITFTTALDTDFFAGIAKLRALRLMWQRILGSSGAPCHSSSITAMAAERVISKVDPWVNMLRTTVTSFAAGLGGADSIVCLPFDHAVGLPDGFSRRIARNTQLILQEESNVHRVIDPAGGAWFIENLTKNIAENAWAKFQSIEQNGGIIPQILDGTLATETDEAWQARRTKIATRRDPLTGVSEFPDIDEKPVMPAQPDIEALRKTARAKSPAGSIISAPDFTSLVDAARNGAGIAALHTALYGDNPKGVMITPLPQHRLAEDFEELRRRALQHAATNGKHPQIFMANIGPVAHHTTRAMFARNFFEAGGIATTRNTGFTSAPDAATAFAKSGAHIAVICGSDAQYADHAPAFANALRQSGATRIYLAGHPGDNRAVWQDAGIDDFIFIGSDVTAVCRTALDHLGVK
ncbi:methylmalonyl-CoA mutase family protein [Thalassospira sp.]|uniref:methylmalonyl-CoA mutase family protein n=1 Tax=Thalassospira sp. TaxID=1912094 RepID=UPI0027374AD1|nr:methylmalonyl-CoA mutase family protein [Thalassospira sp.]MDP2698891.1 methylmalonyl-CoA mutase family protein [Thalassospira sp.]